MVNDCILLSSLTRTCPAKHCTAKLRRIHNSRQKSWHDYIFSLLQHLSGKFTTSSPSTEFNAVYRYEVVIARLLNIVGERGLLFLAMRPKNILSTHIRGFWSRCVKDFCGGLKTFSAAGIHIILSREATLCLSIVNTIWKFARISGSVSYLAGN